VVNSEHAKYLSASSNKDDRSGFVLKYGVLGVNWSKTMHKPQITYKNIGNER
jgi:hypothetical protein